MATPAAKGVPDPLAIDIIVESDLWIAHPAAESLVRKAFATAAAVEPGTGGVAVMLTDDVTIRQLNAQWRGIDQPTNVLSFPSSTSATLRDNHLGDVAIAYETVRREAEAEYKPFLDHLAHLAIHGYLHLIGFDHETDSEANRMESLERQILSKLGIADPHADRTSGD